MSALIDTGITRIRDRLKARGFQEVEVRYSAGIFDTGDVAPRQVQIWRKGAVDDTAVPMVQIDAQLGEDERDHLLRAGGVANALPGPDKVTLKSAVERLDVALRQIVQAGGLDAPHRNKLRDVRNAVADIVGEARTPNE